MPSNSPTTFDSIQQLHGHTDERYFGLLVEDSASDDVRWILGNAYCGEQQQQVENKNGRVSSMANEFW